MENQVAASAKSQGTESDHRPEAVLIDTRNLGDNQGSGPVLEILRQEIPEQPHEAVNGQVYGAPHEQPGADGLHQHREAERLRAAERNQLQEAVLEHHHEEAPIELEDVGDNQGPGPALKVLRPEIPEQPHEAVDGQDIGAPHEDPEADGLDQHQEAVPLHVAMQNQLQIAERLEQPMERVIRRPRYTTEEDHAILNVVANIPLGLKQMKAFDFIRAQTRLNRTSASIYQRYYLYLAAPYDRVRLQDLTDLQKVKIFYRWQNLVPENYRQRLRVNDRLVVSNPITAEDKRRADELLLAVQQGADEEELWEAEENDEANHVVAPVPRPLHPYRALFSFNRNIMSQLDEEDKEDHAEMIKRVDMLFIYDLMASQQLTKEREINLLEAMNACLRNAEGNGNDGQEGNDYANPVVAPAPRLLRRYLALSIFIRYVIQRMDEEDEVVHADMLESLRAFIGNNQMHLMNLTNQSAINLLEAIDACFQNVEWIDED